MEAEAPATADAADRADRKFRREESDGGAPRSFMTDILVLAWKRPHLTIVVETSIIFLVTTMSLEAEAFISLLKTTDALARGRMELRKTAGLSVAQYNVLRILRGASATGDAGLRCAEVGHRLITRDPDVTRLLDRLEKNGLIVRARSEESPRCDKPVSRRRA